MSVQDYIREWILPVSGIVASIIIIVLIFKFLSKSKKKIKSDDQELMTAAVLNKFGAEELFEITEIPKPEIESSDDVIIRVKSASLNPIDIRNKEGYGSSLMKLFGNKSDLFPLVLGRDGSGMVEAVGSKVKRLIPGDEVWFSTAFWNEGCLAQYVCVKEKDVFKKPYSLTHTQAASLPYVTLTTWNALVTRAGLRSDTTSGKRVLILGGTGGIGSFALQLVKAWGAHVTTTCNGNAVEFVKKLGADDVIDYADDVATILSSKEKFDVVLNTIRNPNDSTTVNVCKKNGHVVTVTSPVTFNITHYGIVLGALINIYLLMKIFFTKKILKGVNYKWSFYSSSSDAMETVKELIEKGKVVPVIDKVFSLDEVNLGFEHVREGHARGKTVIEIQ